MSVLDWTLPVGSGGASLMFTIYEVQNVTRNTPVSFSVDTEFSSKTGYLGRGIFLVLFSLP
jgi:hypothetical protein